MREIPLTQGYVAIVDDEDFERLSQWKWCAHRDGGTVYALRFSACRGGKRTMVHMHRAILGTSPGMQTDHIDGNGLNNRRANLRECNQQQNNRNRRSQVRSSSRYLGVFWHKEKQKWQATITVDGRNRLLGRYRVEAEAAEAYKAAASRLFGAFAAGARGDLA